MKLKEAKEILARAGVDDPIYDARELFRTIGGMKAHELISPDAECDLPELTEAVRRRERREPLQHIIGRVDFYRESYRVSEDCLIPRQDTEILVDYAVKNIPKGKKFLDLCTGSGCIAISVLKNTEDTCCHAVDISKKALSVARTNAEENRVEERLRLTLADVTAAAVEGEYFAILSNPPYVTDEAYKALEPEIYFEPREAFVGGEDGGDFYRAITPLYKDKIDKDGFIAYEIGYDQAKLILEIAAYNGMSAEIIKDYSGNARVAVLKNK